MHTKSFVLMCNLSAQLKNLYPVDRYRPISMRGMQEGDALRRQLTGQLSHIEHVICSNCKRARQTAAYITQLVSKTCVIDYEDILYNASLERMLFRIRKISEREAAVLVIGHNAAISLFHQKILSYGDPRDSAVTNHPAGSVVFYRLQNKWAKTSPKHLIFESMIVPEHYETVRVSSYSY